MEDLSVKILETIKEEKITPKPRWTFLLKNYVIWIMCAIALFIGGLATSATIFMIRNNDWDLHRQMGHSLFKFIFITLPYFWILFLITFIFIAYYNFKHTKGGYRYRVPVIATTCLVISMFMGIVFYNSGVGHALDRVFSEKMPIYNSFMNRRQQIWMQPEKGFLEGRVLEVSEKDVFLLEDIKRNPWRVSNEDKNAHTVEVGSFVKVIGSKTGDFEFKAMELRFLRGSEINNSLMREMIHKIDQRNFPPIR